MLYGCPMAYVRHRFLNANFLQMLKFSPLVGIIGHRQVGKTTLIQQQNIHYLTMDDQDTLSLAQKNSKKFVQGLKHLPTALDECQLVPGLFPALKEKVRLNQKPGQVVLSGSVRFSSLKAIRESLTGRIVNLELLPFSVSELTQSPQPNTVLKLLRSANLQQLLAVEELSIKKSFALESATKTYLTNGGLPGICFIRKEDIRHKRIQEQLRLMLDRDLRLVHNTSLPFTQIFDFYKALSIQEGFPIQYSHLQQLVGISEITQKNILNALEGIFLLRRFAIEGGRKGFVFYLEDQAEAVFLKDQIQNSDTKFFQEVEGIIYRNCRVQLEYHLGLSYQFFHFLTSGGARVPVAVRTAEGILGFIPIRDDVITASQRASAHSFLKCYNNSKIVFVTNECKTSHIKIIDSRSLMVPLSWLV